MVLSMRPGGRQGIQFQSAMRAADIGYGSQGAELREKKELGPVRNSPSFDAATGRRTNRGSVSPAYGYIGLALVKCSNDGGPGPRHNMKEDPGSSIFSMLVVDGYYLHLFTSSQNQVTGRTSGDLIPHSDQPGLSTPSTPSWYLPRPLQR